MEWLNYHHLYYFWVVMNEGSITAASERLSLAQSTISAQISKFEESLGANLFHRSGRSLEPTDMGLVVYQYASEIFSLGREMMDALKGRLVEGPLTLKAGIVDAIPKLVAKKLLDPALQLDEKVHLKCHEGKDEQLLAELAMHRLDVVFTDAPYRSNLSLKVYNHLLGECGVTFFATKEMAIQIQENFPSSLDAKPMLFPMPMSPLRGLLDQWFEKLRIQPVIAGEFDDHALLKVFGQAGEGVFATPSVIEHEVSQQYQVEIIGRTQQITEKFYAISVERILRHPAVMAISEAAKNRLFF